MKRILVAPLDWGLGHATRCVPVIKEFVRQGNEVLIAADGSTEKLLREEFPDLKFIYLEGYHISYSSTLPAWIKILFLLPRIFWRAVSEHNQMKKIIGEHKIDVIVSDNRFGLWNKNIRSIYITHQLMIKCPKGLKVFEPFIYRVYKWLINNYDHCWIPDFEGEENISGDLSHKYPMPENAKFIGLLSRFSEINIESSFEYALCVILSGPEPARSELENIIFDQLKSFKGSAVVILGKPEGNHQIKTPERVKVFSHLSSQQLKDFIKKSKLVLCRSGYSSVMDLIALKRNAVLIPTHGQTEQEYLSDYLHERKIFKSVFQNNLNLQGLTATSDFSVSNFGPGQSKLSKEIEKIISSV